MGCSATGYVRVPGFHPLLPLDAGWTFRGEAEDPEQKADAEAEVAERGGAASDAHARGRPASLAMPGAEGYYMYYGLPSSFFLAERILRGHVPILVPSLAAEESEAHVLAGL